MMEIGCRTLWRESPATRVRELDVESELKQCGYGPEIRFHDAA